MSGLNFGNKYMMTKARKDQDLASQKEGIFYNEKTNKYLIRKKNMSRNKFMVPYVTVAQFNSIEEAELFYNK